MRHYFIDRERKTEEFFEFKESFLDYTYVFKSCNDVFSKNEIDTGSKVLIKAFLQEVENNTDAKVLDLGCGYGAISVNIKKHLPNIDLYLSDVVKTATELAKENLKINNLNGTVVLSNLFDNVDNDFDFIVSNPPIKTGKDLLFKFACDSYNHLKDEGKLYLVIRKDLGMQSLKTKLIEVYGNCEIIKREKGFYILKCLKSGK